MENVDDNFINQLRCLIEEYGYQLPMETEKDAEKVGFDHKMLWFEGKN